MVWEGRWAQIGAGGENPLSSGPSPAACRAYPAGGSLSEDVVCCSDEGVSFEERTAVCQTGTLKPKSILEQPPLSMLNLCVWKSWLLSGQH